MAANRPDRIEAALDDQLRAVLRRACTLALVPRDRAWCVGAIAQLFEVIVVEEAALALQADGATREDAVLAAAARFGLEPSTHERRLRRWREACRHEPDNLSGVNRRSAC